MKGKVFTLAKQLGATITYDSHAFAIEAPRGMQWKGQGVHELVYDGEFWIAMLNDLNIGFEKCHEKDCEWCDES